LFIDFKAAYDSVITKQLYKVMNELGIPENLTTMVRVTMENSSSSTRLQNSFSDPLEVTNGLRQGDVLACLLFNTALQKVIIDSCIQTNKHTFTKSVQIIAYADDVVLTARTCTRDLTEGFRSL
jgi:sorting nexin-29